MAWGYEASFIIEHVYESKKKSCKKCKYYNKEDMSCKKHPYYLPVDGFDSWKRCEYFTYGKKVAQETKEKMTKSYPSSNTGKPINYKPENKDFLKHGTRIEHKKYGKGTIMNYDKGVVEVSFDDNKEKIIQLQLECCEKKGLIKQI